MRPSRRLSALEAVPTVVVGSGFAVLEQIMIFPVQGLAVGLGDSVRIAGRQGDPMIEGDAR